MARTLKINKTTKEDAHRETARQAAREAILEFQSQEDNGPSEDLFESLDHSNQAVQQTAQAANEAFDLFDYCDELQSKGVIVQYTVKKNNVLIASAITHPYSWEKIQKQYGEGLYQVLAKNAATKQFIKSQTQMLGSVDVDNMDKETEKTENQNQFGVMEMMTLLERKAQEARREAREEAQRMAEIQEKQQNTMLTLVTALVSNKPAGPSAAETQLQTMQMMTQMMDKIQNNTNLMFERLSNRIEKIAEGATNKESFTALDIMKMTSDAQAKGFEMYNRMEEMAEKKAQEKIELIEEYKDEDSDDKEDKKESATDSLIKTILPTIVTALSGSRLPQAQPHPMQAQQNQQQLMARRNAEAQEIARRKEVLKRKAEQAELNKVINEANTSPLTNIVSGLPKVDFEAETNLASNFSDEVVSDSVKNKCLEILPPFLGQLMIEASGGNVTNEQAAEATMNYLTEHGISRAEFIANVESQDLIDVANEYSLPEEAKVWLNELYGNIQNTNRTDARREFTADHA